MPREGYASITVSEEVYDRVSDMAKKAGKSVSKFVSELILRTILEPTELGVEEVVQTEVPV